MNSHDRSATPESLPKEAATAAIRVRGARTHNLKNISLDIPRNQLVVLTGLSGSGKSSLAFDTLYAEGQRRYVESLSAYARQFLQRMEKPDVDLIEGLAPAISIEQKSASHNPRSTVGTVTEILDYLRLLWARAGTPHCPQHPQQALRAQTVSQMVDTVLERPAGQRLALLAPVVHARKGGHAELLAALRAQGYVRFRVDGQVLEAEHIPALDDGSRHDVEVVVDRVKTGGDLRQRLAESLEAALRLSDGRALALDLDSGELQSFNSRFACPICGTSLPELEPRLFSFNNPAGACPECDGLGHVEVFDPALVVAHPELGLASGAIRGWDKRNRFYFEQLQALAAHDGFELDTPFEQLPETVRQRVLHGTGDERIAFAAVDAKGRSSTRRHPFEGVLPNLQRRWLETETPAVREELARLRSVHSCPACSGTRLRPEARLVRVGEASLPEVCALTLQQAQAWFDELELDGAKAEIAARIRREIASRLRFLNDVGLRYLSLDRSADTLSGGEAQRIRLASQIGSGLTGVMYVLDEPSIGLHQRDNDRLIATLKHLRDLGNSVLVVEHDEDMIRAADHVVDMGPGAGIHGGEVVAQGTPEAVAADPASLTGQYLSGRRHAAATASRRAPGEQWLELAGARGNNLREVTARIPLGLLTVVSGVSGSGKSTLVNDTLYAAAAAALNGAHTEPAPYEALHGLQLLDKVIAVDQSPLGRTPRSNPATYTGLFTPLRELFAQTNLARERGFDAGRFSFNVKGGRCEACQGDGLVKVEMHFLPDMYVPCDVCHGKRYNRETLDVTWHGLNIAEVLELSVDQALEQFKSVPAIARKLQTLREVGLGYIRLGQSATTLSGGEAQRVKLALELSRRDTGRTLYILDEPTTGLHFADIDMLLDVLLRLRDAGNTIVVIEHNLDVIASADWVIDLGPEGGAGGGRIVASGTPEQLATQGESATAPYLARVLEQRSGN
ncbi:MAG: excinuclease ABC subunit UvrA [Betaproteobacteria bacterium]|nr:excinuclease ABC subunit UvrA [Betaproteobacteria bacterium]MBU6511796.1 excinuclease ABC subunit UvrA [Betaproteobacteria bacterium]MDE1955057.1 excinuclease ABC subunit UvrA [Betaproteobacteria bacterium]MDE2152104.1 excinuclease ABC subunit UvrA [Betaproteobacteria bacterium]